MAAWCWLAHARMVQPASWCSGPFGVGVGHLGEVGRGGRPVGVLDHHGTRQHDGSSPTSSLPGTCLFYDKL